MSDLHLVAMPKWGLSMEAGQIVGWHKPVGADLAAGEDLIDVETTKITNTIEAPASGRLLRILAAVGDTVACGAALAVIGPDGASDSEIDRFVAEHGASQRHPSADAAVAVAEPSVTMVHVGGEDVRIRYLETGTGDETIVLIHGLGGDLENWMFNQPVLALNKRVVAIDLPGHGGSDKRVGSGSAAVLAETVRALLATIAPGRVHLVGHSFGAMVARHLFAVDRARFATLTAIAPADLGPVERAYIDGFIGARRRSELGAAIAMLFADPTLATREMAEALLRYKRLDGVEQALGAIDAANFARVGPDPEAIALWETIGRQGMLIWGDRDAVVPLASAKTDFPGVVTQVIAGAGHMPHLERAERITALIVAHISSEPGLS